MNSGDLRSATSFGAQLQRAASSAAAPSHTFVGDENTGMYRIAADRLGFATAGVARWEVAAAGALLAASDGAFDIGADGASRPNNVYLAGFIQTGDGTTAAPSHSFDSDPDTGMFRVASNVVALVTGANERGRFDGGAGAATTGFHVYDVDNTALERVSVGIADSGGAGFKLLRIAN